MAKKMVEHPYHRILFSNTRNKLLMHSSTGINLMGIMLSKKKPIPKGNILCDSNYISFEMTKILKQRTDE